MEDIREVAKAYYVNLTKQQQEKAQDEFKNMKLENNKSMSLNDFLDFFLQDNYPKTVACSLFKDLDLNGDGSLDFDEFITLFYLYQSKRLLYCRGCETFLNGLYFTCIKCFDSTSNSYDLCLLCYQKKNIQHHRDAVFLDNYALLRRNIKRSSETAVVDPVQENDNKIKEDVDESGQVKNDENEGQYISELWDHQKNEANEVVANASNQLEKITNQTVANIQRYGENEVANASNQLENEVANASNQLEKIANRKVENIHRYRNRERVGKAFSKLGANITSKVTSGISKATDKTDCNVM